VTSLRRPKFRLVGLMVLIALCAGMLGVWRMHEHRLAVARALADMSRAGDRLAWAERMHEQGYLNGPRLAASRLDAERARAELERLGVEAAPPAR
jgi:hypothetical protein